MTRLEGRVGSCISSSRKARQGNGQGVKMSVQEGFGRLSSRKRETVNYGRPKPVDGNNRCLNLQGDNFNFSTLTLFTHFEPHAPRSPN